MTYWWFKNSFDGFYKRVTILLKRIPFNCEITFNLAVWAQYQILNNDLWYGILVIQKLRERFNKRINILLKHLTSNDEIILDWLYGLSTFAFFFSNRNNAIFFSMRRPRSEMSIHLECSIFLL